MKHSIVTLMLLTTVLLAGFQNCAPVDFAMEQAAKASDDDDNDTPTVLVCDPFSSSSNCSGNVTAKIYRLEEAQRTAHGTEGLDTYFTYGTKLDATIQLDRLFIPTVPFTTGFPAAGGGFLLDENGDLLIEYFAMKLKTRLTQALDQPAATYQLALLSDDGARLVHGITGQVIVDNDGSHPTKLGCATTTITLNPGDKLPIDIDYYQGPRQHIALSLMWRKVDSTTNLNDALCGTQGNDFYFGANYDDFSNARGFGQLTDRGWTPVPAANLTGVLN